MTNGEVFMTKIKKLTIAITTAILAVAITASILVACSSNNSDGSKTDKESATATESVTEKATEKPTEKETEKSSEKATEKSTEKSTATETENSTEKSTEKTNNKENKHTDTNTNTEDSKQVTYYTTTVDNNDQNSNNNNSSSDNSSAGDNSSQSSNNNSNNNSSTNTKTWHEAEYKTVHHEAETKKVWVVDQESYTYEEPVYETHGVTICNICGADITDCVGPHGYNHMINGENPSYHDEWREIQVGTKTVTVEEKGHWETQVIKEAWTEQVLVREAGYY